MGGGARTSMRMTAAQKAEYDQYMQNLLKTRGFNPGPGDFHDQANAKWIVIRGP
jgi:hypothetical protein